MSSATRDGRARPSRVSCHVRLAVLAVATPLTGLALPATLEAQGPVFNASAQALVYQYGDRDPGTDSPGARYLVPPGGGCFERVAGAGAVAANVAACNVPANAGGGGTAAGRAVAEFDPGAGVMRSGAFLSANNFTLAQFIPQYDASGNRVYTGAQRPDALGAWSVNSLYDQLLVQHAPGVAPATLDLFLDWNGTLRADPQAGDLTSFASSYINFCTAAVNFCGAGVPNTEFRGNASFLLFSSGPNNGSGGLNVNGSAPPGQGAPALSFAGTQTATELNGRLTIANVPIASANMFEFSLNMGTEALFVHPSVNQFGPLTECDPAREPDTCGAVPPINVAGQIAANFTQSLHFSGYRVLDANGNDITSQVSVRFNSGIFAAPTAVPEPATVALVAGGLLVVGGVAARRRMA